MKSHTINNKDCLETKYVSRNPDIQQLFREINERVQAGSISINDMELYQMIRENNWRTLDSYIQRHIGKDNFYRILKELLTYKYFLPETQQITRKQMQNALGIQQARWVNDPENTYICPSYDIKAVTFKMWEEIPNEEKTIMLEQIHENIRDRLNPGMTKNNINSLFNNTVWYLLDVSPPAPPRPPAKRPTTPPRPPSAKRPTPITPPRPPFVGGYIGWKGYGEKRLYYPIPETINLSTISTVYPPILVFGSLSELTLARFVVEHRQRPYASHLANSKSNLTCIHDKEQTIFANWVHDFQHSRSDPSFTIAGDDFFSFLNSTLRDIIGVELLTPENAVNKLAEIADSITIKPEDNEETKQEKIRKKARVMEYIGYVNDTGRIWHREFRPFAGGRKALTRRIRKSKRKKTRKTKRTTYKPRAERS